MGFCKSMIMFTQAMVTVRVTVTSLSNEFLTDFDWLIDTFIHHYLTIDDRGIIQIKEERTAENHNL